jgi:hypothetical protein
MATLDENEATRRARRAYELGRARLALARTAPIALLVAGYLWLESRSPATLAVAVALYGVGLAFVWRGQVAGRALLPGFGAGLLALVCSRVSPACDQLCAGSLVASLCVPLCTFGGFAAGLVIARSAGRRAGAGRYWLYAALVALLTGSLACSCVGLGGVLGLAAGLALTGVPVLARRAPAE